MQVDDSAQVINSIRQRVNWLVGEIGTARRQAGDVTSVRDAAIKALHDQHDPIIQQHNTRADELVHELVTLVEKWFDQLVMPGTATVRVDNGEVSRHRSGQPALVIDDEAALVRSIRRRRKVTELLTRTVTFSVNKNALKKRPDLKSFPGVRLVREVSWLIRPGKTPGLTISQPANPRPTD